MDVLSNAVHMHAFKHDVYDVIGAEKAQNAGIELSLSIGTVENNDFHLITENEQIPIEQEVRVELADSTQSFGYIL